MQEPELTKRRIVSLIDMDCFYVQCEQRLSPETWDKPCAVAQYNNWTGGGLIAVNYQARPFGVKRGMRSVEAKKCCPDLHIFTVPERNGKADLTRYREASGEVFDAITDCINKLEGELGKRGLIILERASIDEAFIELSDYISAKPLELPKDSNLLESFNTKVVFNGLSLEDWLQSIQKEDGSIEDSQLLSSYFQNIPISQVRSLGGQFGEGIQNSLNIQTMGQLQQVDKDTLMKHFDPETAEWLHCYSQGYDYSKVTKRSLASSIGCSKNFPGHLVLATMEDIEHWVKVLCEEAYDRIESDRELNKRVAQQLVVGHNSSSGQHTKALNITLDGEKYPLPEQLTKMIIKAVFEGYDAKANPLSNLSINVTKFEAQKLVETFPTIRNYFSKIDRSVSKVSDTASSVEPTATSDTKDETVIENAVETNEDQEDKKEVDQNEKDTEEIDKAEDPKANENVEKEKEYCSCDCKKSETETSSEKESQDGTNSVANEEQTETADKPSEAGEGSSTYEDLPPERMKQLKNSFFYQKALELYDNQNDSDSDLVDYPDDWEEDEELLENERKSSNVADDISDDIEDILLEIDNNSLRYESSDEEDDQERKKKRARIEPDE
ncbi:hypothetical protein TYRP_000944 [Tyrophagus putrescentiae]|nr:hypothetical protein TYRP_000944 [Tyrophagus putrescentiae]